MNQRGPRTIPTLLITGAALAAASGCGTQISPGTGDDGTSSTTSTALIAPGAELIAPGTELVGVGTVLEQGAAGAQLCLGAIEDSLPPQCSGPAIARWDWAQASGSQEANGVRWGTYAVIGTFDGDTFNLTRPPLAPEAYQGPRPEAPSYDFRTPCPEPDGGWRPLDLARTTDAALGATLTAAQARADYAASWVDQSLNPASSETDTSSGSALMNDPTQLILNLRVTGNLAAAEQAARATWGGALCVSKATHTEKELLDIMAAIQTSEGPVLEGSPDGISVQVSMSVLFDDGSLQRRLDATYGPGLVRVRSQLVPYHEAAAPTPHAESTS